MIKKLTTTVILFLLLFSPSSVSASTTSSQVIIINQVRGSEDCCQPGSLKNLKEQILLHQEMKIPAHFLVRYDALKDPSFTTELKKALNTSNHLIKLGVLVEITPSLAKNAGVNYQATQDTWQEAQHVFTIGYSKEDRQKLINQLLNRFYQTFGFFPKLTGGWMIDTPTLNYLQKEFHVKAHLITREQWAVDTYHLYGGPPHYPYPASLSWIFMPDYSIENPVLILRQTVTDPLYNYGDTASAFTSQPNDYLNGNKNFSYFKSLLDQALLKQPNSPGFALLGLENSMENKYQQEFSRQLKYLTELQKNNQIVYPSLDDLIKTWAKSPLTIYTGKDLTGKSDSQSAWITTPNYRLRLLITSQNILITDLRLYHPNLKDPYTNYQAVKEGYWIAPYLLDASLNQKSEKIKRSFWLKIFGPPPPSPSFTKVQSDLINQTTSLTLPTKNQKEPIWEKLSNGNLTLKGPANIVFQPDSIIIKDIGQNDLKYKNFNPEDHPIKFKKTSQGFSLTWTVNQQESHKLQTTCQKDQCIINFTLNPDVFIKAQELQYPFLFPERKPRPTDKKNTVLYVHNRYAIANRNPVRIIFIPKDKFGLPIIPEEEISLETNPPVTHSSQFSNQQDQSNQIIDLTSEKPTRTKLTIKLNQQTLKNTTVFFAPNCKQNLKHCLTHPLQATWYIKAILHDKIRLKFFGENQ